MIVGSTSERIARPGSLHPSGGNPWAGKISQWTANRITSIKPTQNVGSAMPSWLTTDKASPSALRCRAPATMPSGTATRIDSTVEAITSGALTSSFCASSSVTEAPFNADVPKSPDRIPPHPVDVLLDE